MNLRSPTVLLSLLAVLATAGAQAQEKVLREGQVTQQALIDALAPAASPAEAASAPADAPRTRGFKPGAARPAAPEGRASILITFVTGSAELTADARRALDVLAGAMKSEKLAAMRFTVEGHADPRGGELLNLRLSQSRADSVRGYLTGTHGLAAGRVDAVGKGASALMNAADPAAPENRRVTIVAQPG